MRTSMITAAALVASCLTQTVRADEAVTHIGFPSPATLKGTKLYAEWNAPFYVCAEKPQDTTFKPISSFAAGQSPWMHFVVGSLENAADKLTRIHLKLFDANGRVIQERDLKYDASFTAQNVRWYSAHDPNWATLKPGVYALCATANPDRRPASDAVTVTANWGFTVTAGKTSATGAALAQPNMRNQVAAPAKAEGAVASKAGGDFVLIDGQCTRLPVMSCKMPNGCVALGKVIWNSNVSDPIRYHIQAVGVADGAQSTVSGGFAVVPRNRIAGSEVSVPAQIAQLASGEICGIYGLQNLRVLSANAVAMPDAVAKAFANTLTVGARQRGIAFTSSWVKEMHFKYGGLRNGKPMLINAVFPYFYFVTAGTYTTGMVMELATTCSSAENEQLALERLAVMRKSRFINMAFSQKLDAIIQGRTDAWIKNNNQMVQTMMRINQDLEDSYARNREATWYSSQRRSSAVDRFCDAIRGEERVSNPTTGREMYVSTEYDHCAVNAFGDQLYWNGSGATANFDPNSSAAFNNVRWGKVK